MAPAGTMRMRAVDRFRTIRAAGDGTLRARQAAVPLRCADLR
jgi:hypothetical protein